MSKDGDPENGSAAGQRPRRFVLPASASIPFSTIDEEHGVIIDTLNGTLFIAEQIGSTAILSETLLATLYRHVAEHFAHEEQMMCETNYPGLPEHRRHHNDLLDRLRSFGKKATQGCVETVDALEEFFAGFLDDTLSSDLHFKTYLQGRGLIPG